MSRSRTARTIITVLAASAGLTLGLTGVASAAAVPDLDPTLTAPMHPGVPDGGATDPADACPMPPHDPGMARAEVCPSDPRVTTPHGVLDPGPTVVDPEPEVRDHRGPGGEPGGGVLVGPTEPEPVVRDHRTPQPEPVVRDHRGAAAAPVSG
ncbi:hypothetical protein ACFWPA_07745 [Rhodococcus sp. NPDC058505]|uniref:hypothetical protein n=1 Tax=unclassified Rhodococcus (in: high G+C Gram-positive bacteria) TaxID=192944 RepID=UPI00365A1216